MPTKASELTIPYHHSGRSGAGRQVWRPLVGEFHRRHHDRLYGFASRPAGGDSHTQSNGLAGTWYPPGQDGRRFPARGAGRPTDAILEPVGKYTFEDVRRASFRAPYTTGAACTRRSSNIERASHSREGMDCHGRNQTRAGKHRIDQLRQLHNARQMRRRDDCKASMDSTQRTQRARRERRVFRRRVKSKILCVPCSGRGRLFALTQCTLR